MEAASAHTCMSQLEDNWPAVKGLQHANSVRFSCMNMQVLHTSRDDTQIGTCIVARATPRAP